MTATGAMADAPAAPAALRPDVDLVSWPSDSDMTVVRVSRQRRQLVSSAGAAVRRLGDGEVCVREPGDGLQDPSLSLVNLATLQQPDGDQSSVRLEPLSSWDRAVLEHGDVLPCCAPQFDGGTGHAAPRELADKAVTGVPAEATDDKILEAAVQTLPPTATARSVRVGPAGDAAAAAAAAATAPPWWRTTLDLLLCLACVPRRRRGSRFGSANSVPYGAA